MRPDDANDGATPEGPSASATGDPSSSEPVRDAEDLPDLDGGGDPACWLGLVDDQRDHQPPP